MAHIAYKPHPKPGKKIKKNILDKLIYPIALIAPLMTVPQLLDVVLHHKTQGVSLLTWGAYAGVSFFWVLYGLHHKEKPIIIANTLLCILDSAIVIGVLVAK